METPRTSKKTYGKPALSTLGSIEEITGWVAGGAGEYFGGNKTARVKVGRCRGPADFGS